MSCWRKVGLILPMTLNHPIHNHYVKAATTTMSRLTARHAFWDQDRGRWWHSSLTLKQRLSILSLGVVAGLIALFVVNFWWEVPLWRQEPLLSPISELSSFAFLRRYDFGSENEKVVYGFLPYWNLNQVKLQPELTHLAYFSLTIGADGSLITTNSNGTEREPGFHQLNSQRFLTVSNQALAKGQKVEIVLTQFNGDDIRTFLATPAAHDRLIQSLGSVLLAYPISGINIDIELNGPATASDRENLTQFMTSLRSYLDGTYDHVQLSIDVYASAANNRQIWDINELEPLVDYFVVMAYDFHQRSSPQAGPVAPLFGGQSLWDSDINYHLREFLQIVPPEKILLGIPFYGYEWQTTSRQPQAHTFPNTGRTASYERVQTILENAQELSVEQNWSEEALSPYISYLRDDQIYVIYYEDSRSISYKLDYVNQLGLGGIAIWALGYEGESRELWDIIERKFK